MKTLKKSIYLRLNGSRHSKLSNKLDIFSLKIVKIFFKITIFNLIKSNFIFAMVPFTSLLVFPLLELPPPHSYPYIRQFW